MPIENKCAAIAGVVGLFLMLRLTDGSPIAAFGVLALIAGIGWAARRFDTGRGGSKRRAMLGAQVRGAAGRLAENG